MADFVFNISKGKFAYYATLPAASDALIAIPLEAAGLEADATLKDYDDLAALLAGSSNEQTVMGRKVLTSVASTPDDTNERLDVTGAIPLWSNATGNPVAAIVVCYDPDTTGGTDSSLIPLLKYDCALTPDGTDFAANSNAAGLARAS